MKILHSKIIGQDKPLLILHGLLGMGDNWITLARQYVGAGFEVHLIDQRNHGKSFHDDEMSYEVLVDDLYRYLQMHRIEKFDLLGHSMGGKTAMFFALQYPELLNKLIVVDIAPKAYPPHHHFIFDTINKIDLLRFHSRREVEKFVLQFIDSKAIVRFILKNLGRDARGHFKWKANMPVLEASLGELGEALPALQESPVPALFIKGAQSSYILPEDFALIKAHFPNSKIITIPQSGHWVHAEQPAAFFEKTLAFLT